MSNIPVATMQENNAPSAAVPNGSGGESAGPKKYTLKDLQENGTAEKLYMLLHDKGARRGLSAGL